MFHSSTIFRHQEKGPAQAVAYLLELPAGSEGKMVPTETVVKALLWQYYGLDLLHPEVSRWLEQNAPDVKYAVVESRQANGDSRGRAEFRVGSDRTIRVYLSLAAIDRLREISSQYLLRQVEESREPQPPMEPVEPEIVQAASALKQVRHSIKTPQARTEPDVIRTVTASKPVRRSAELRKEQIAPEIIQAIIAQAAASRLSVDDYLARLLGSTFQHN